MRTPDPAAPRRVLPSSPGPAIAVAVAVAIVVVSAWLTWEGKQVDTPTYALAASRIVDGEMIYRPEDRPPFTYPPFFALVFAPFLLVPPSARLFAWNLCNSTLLAVIVAQVVALVLPWIGERPDRTLRRDWLCLVVATVLSLRFLVSPLEYRAHDYFVLLAVLLSAGAHAAGRQAAAGAWAGFATACKATPLLLLPMFAWQRSWRASAAMAGSVVALTLLPDVLTPSATGRPWFLSWYETFVSKVDLNAAAAAHGAWKSWNPLNQSLSGTLHRLFTPAPADAQAWDASLVALSPPLLRLVVGGCQAAILAAFFRGTRGAADRRPPTPASRFRTLGQYSVALCCMLLLSPMSSTQHFCGLFPAIAFATSVAVYGRRSPLLYACLAVAFVTGPMSAKDIVGSRARLPLQASGVTTCCALACLAATLVALRDLAAEESAERIAGGGTTATTKRRPASRRVLPS